MAFVLDNYQELVPGDKKQKFLYGLCAMGCASRLRKFAADMADDCFIRYAFESGGTGSRKAFRAFEKLLDDGEGDFYRMHSLSKAGKDCLPLQAADLHAYEVHKYFSDQIEETGRPPRKSLQALLSIQEAGGGGYLFTTEKFNQYLSEMKSGNERPNISVDPLNAERRVFLKKRDGLWGSSVYFKELGAAIKPPPAVHRSPKCDL